MKAENDKAKCAGQDNTGNNVCRDRERCGRYVRPAGDYQVWSDFWKAGIDCHHYESIQVKRKPEVISWEGADENRINVIGQNGNDGLHYK